MIDVIELHQFISQTRRSGSSGLESDTEFNTNLKAVDKELYRTLIPMYAKDDRIQKIFMEFITRAPFTAVSGTANIPENFAKFIDVEFPGGKIVYPRNLNEKAGLKSSSVSNPTLESDEYFCFFENNKISFLPETVTAGHLVYIREAVPGEIRFDITEDEDSDYITPVKVRDIEWPEELFGLFSALMLEKYSVQFRETVIAEYANLGIQKEVINSTR